MMHFFLRTKVFWLCLFFGETQNGTNIKSIFFILTLFWKIMWYTLIQFKYWLYSKYPFIQCSAIIYVNQSRTYWHIVWAWGWGYLNVGYCYLNCVCLQDCQSWLEFIYKSRHNLSLTTNNPQKKLRSRNFCSNMMNESNIFTIVIFLRFHEKKTISWNCKPWRIVAWW